MVRYKHIKKGDKIETEFGYMIVESVELLAEVSYYDCNGEKIGEAYLTTWEIAEAIHKLSGKCYVIIFEGEEDDD